ncbi:MAG: F0F1 ATP synthase subunit beta, partial [Caldilineaceae bacterium]|nr:F0F1 ATP synthase subunit beta [Caldilineaceae bacterium]
MTNQGTITAVRGSVIDAHFPHDLPALQHELRAGGQHNIVIEVALHLGGGTVRGLALTPTQGLARGDAVIDTGHPLLMPIGPQVLGRVLNVFGDVIDEQGPPSADTWAAEQWAIHQAPPPIIEQATAQEILATGIKAIDLLAPLERGGKAGLFGGAGVGKTVLITEMIHNMV